MSDKRASRFDASQLRMMWKRGDASSSSDGKGAHTVQDLALPAKEPSSEARESAVREHDFLRSHIPGSDPEAVTKALSAMLSTELGAQRFLIVQDWKKLCACVAAQRIGPSGKASERPAATESVSALLDRLEDTLSGMLLRKNAGSRT